MQELISRLVLPLGAALALLAIGRLWRRTSPRTANAATSLAIACLVIFSLPATSAALIRSLQDDHPAAAPETLPDLDVVVVLGGGLQGAALPRHRVELGPGGDRMLLAFELWRTGRADALLIASGVPMTPPASRLGDGRPVTEADLSADLLRWWGVPADALMLERASLDTIANAERTARLLEDAGGCIGLITSATHMTRAMSLFRAAGLDPVALPADHWVIDGAPDPLDFVPSAVHLGGSTRALREYLGIGWNLLTGRVRWEDVYPAAQAAPAGHVRGAGSAADVQSRMPCRSAQSWNISRAHSRRV